MGSEDYDKNSSLDLDLQHLQAELARIDLLFQRSTDRWQLVGQDTAVTFRGLYVSDDHEQVLIARPLCTS